MQDSRAWLGGLPRVGSPRIARVFSRAAEAWPTTGVAPTGPQAGNIFDHFAVRYGRAGSDPGLAPR